MPPGYVGLVIGQKGAGIQALQQIPGVKQVGTSGIKLCMTIVYNQDVVSRPGQSQRAALQTPL